jgi:predicted ATPase
MTSSSSSGWFSSSFGRNNNTNSEKKDSNGTNLLTNLLVNLRLTNRLTSLVQVKSRKTLIFTSPAPSSLYLYGGTGCGKTYLMDLFYDTLPMKGIHLLTISLLTHSLTYLLREYRQKTNSFSQFYD